MRKDRRRKNKAQGHGIVVTISSNGTVSIPVQTDKKLASVIAESLGDLRAMRACDAECGVVPIVGEAMCG